MKIIPLSQGKETLVDDADYEFLRQYPWHYHQGYASHGIRLKGKVKILMMHRVIMLAPNDGCEIDHIDLDKLNNQKLNLRFTDDVGNGRNKGLRVTNTSGFKGVYWHKEHRKWCANIKAGDKRYYLGDFNTALEGAIAYNNAVRKYHGEHGRLNVIPDRGPEAKLNYLNGRL